MKWAKWQQFLHDRRGAVLVEVAILFPILSMLLLTGMEVARYTLLQQKLSRAAVTMSDLIAQAPQINQTQMANLYQSIEYVVEPFEIGGQGIVIISSLSQTAGAAKVDWQCRGGGTHPAPSEAGTSGGPATLPTGFLLRDGESAIFAEVAYVYDPFLVPNLFGTELIRHHAIFRPRFGALKVLAPPTIVVPGAPSCS